MTRATLLAALFASAFQTVTRSQVLLNDKAEKIHVNGIQSSRETLAFAQVPSHSFRPGLLRRMYRNGWSNTESRIGQAGGWRGDTKSIQGMALRDLQEEAHTARFLVMGWF